MCCGERTINDLSSGEEEEKGKKTYPNDDKITCGNWKHLFIRICVYLNVGRESSDGCVTGEKNIQSKNKNGILVINVAFMAKKMQHLIHTKEFQRLLLHTEYSICDSWASARANF